VRRRGPERRPARRARRHQAPPLGLAPPRKAKPQPSLIAHRNRWTSLLAASAKSDPQPGIEPGSPSNSRTRSESRLNGTGAQGTPSGSDEHRSLVPERIAKAQRMPCTTGPGPGSATITATGTMSEHARRFLEGIAADRQSRHGHHLESSPRTARIFGRFPRTSRHPESEPTPKGARSLAKPDDDERIFTWNMRRLADDDPVLARAAESSIVRWSSLRDYVWDMRQRITIEMIRELSEARVPLDTRLAALLKTSREPLRDDLVDAMAAWFGIPRRPVTRGVLSSSSSPSSSTSTSTIRGWRRSRTKSN